MDIKKLLIVEDSVDYRFLLQKLFTKFGFEVKCAENGKVALGLLDSFAPNVILLDLMMPVMDGHEFRAQQLSEARWADIPVILMTAHGDVKADQRNFFDYVRKPADIERLKSAVNRAVSS